MPVSATRSRDDLGLAPYDIDPEDAVCKFHDCQR